MYCMTRVSRDTFLDRNHAHPLHTKHFSFGDRCLSPGKQFLILQLMIVSMNVCSLDSDRLVCPRRIS